jgi:hypothetical protein
MMMKRLTIVSVFATLTFTPLSVFAQPNASLQGLRVQCLGVEHDGSQTLRVQGTGRNKTDAQEQAKKNAVIAVLFNGVSGCDIRPLLPEANAREKYVRYFDIFFMDKGEYAKYVSMEDTRPNSQTKNRRKVQRTYTITVRVLRSQLAERLRNDGLLPEEKTTIQYY